MVDPITWRRFQFRVLFLLVCAFVIFLKLLPLSIEPSRIPGPDLLFLFTAAWIMRRPRWAPVLLIVAVHLLSDILFLRPLGLWTAITLVAFEFLRGQAHQDGEVPIPLEIAMVAGCFTIAILVNAAIHAALSLSHPGAVTTLLMIVVTAIFYPFVIAISHFILGVRPAKPSDGETEAAAG